MPAREPSAVVGVGVMTLFVGLFAFQVWLWRAGTSEWGRRWYVHAMNGFYVGTMGNRLLDRLWPRALMGR